MSHVCPLLAVITDAVIVLHTPNQISMYIIVQLKFDNKHYYIIIIINRKSTFKTRPLLYTLPNLDI